MISGRQTVHPATSLVAVAARAVRDILAVEQRVRAGLEQRVIRVRDGTAPDRALAPPARGMPRRRGRRGRRWPPPRGRVPRRSRTSRARRTGSRRCWSGSTRRGAPRGRLHGLAGRCTPGTPGSCSRGTGPGSRRPGLPGASPPGSRLRYARPQTSGLVQVTSRAWTQAISGKGFLGSGREPSSRSVHARLRAATAVAVLPGNLAGASAGFCHIPRRASASSRIGYQPGGTTS
jgi:hypothetical protein